MGLQSAPVRWFLGLTVVVAVALFGQLFHLQVVQGARNQSLADGNRIRQNVIRAPRGEIYDRNGALLARNVANFDLVAFSARMPKKHEERRAGYDRLAKIMGRPASEIKSAVEKGGLA